METTTQVRAYGALIRAGCTAWRLKGLPGMPDQPWTQEFECFGPLTPEQCKPYVEEYLGAAYNARDITFLRRPSQGEHQFYCQFVRGDL